jgi:integrase
MTPDASLNLRAYHLATHEPLFLCAARPRHLAAMRQSADLWHQHAPTVALRDISTLDLATWKAALAKTRTPATVNKHLRHIAAILNKAGPPGPKNRDALGAIADVPWTKPLPEPGREIRTIPASHLAALHQACDAATHPRANAATWWRGWLVAAYNLAMRTTAMRRIQQTDVDWHNRTVRIPADADKANRPRTKPINETTLRHLLPLRQPAGALFPWTASDQTFYRTWHAIQTAAAIPKPHYKLHDLKRTAGTAAAKLAPLDDVRRLLDHSNLRTTALYLAPTNDLRQLTDQLPQPWDQPPCETKAPSTA